MAEGSSVDEIEQVNVINGLNLTTEILKEDGELDSSWEMYSEDSIDNRAAQALDLCNVKDLLPRRKLKQSKRLLRSSRSESPAQSLAGIIYSSMTSDMRAAAFSVSPSPSRLRSGCSSRSSLQSACSTLNSCTTPNSIPTSTPKKSKKALNISNKDILDLNETMSRVQHMHLLPNDDSLLSEPELDFAFEDHRQTMDILAAAGNLNERRVAHGGYGTPSSYASEQELKLYFNNTPVSDAVVNVPEFATAENKAETSLQTIMRLERSMSEQVIPIHNEEYETSCQEYSVSAEMSSSNLLSSPKYETELDALPRSNVTNSHSILKEGYEQRNSPNLDLMADFADIDKENKPRKLKRNSNNDLPIEQATKQSLIEMSKLHLNGESRLMNMIKAASASVIDKETSHAVLLGISTLDTSKMKQVEDSLSEFDSFQEYLKEFKEYEHQKVESNENSFGSTIPKFADENVVIPIELNVEDSPFDKSQFMSECLPCSTQQISDCDTCSTHEESSTSSCSFSSPKSIESDSKLDLNNDCNGYSPLPSNDFTESIPSTKETSEKPLSTRICIQSTDDSAKIYQSFAESMIANILHVENNAFQSFSSENDLYNNINILTEKDQLNNSDQNSFATSKSIPESPIYFERDNDGESDQMTARFASELCLEIGKCVDTEEMEVCNEFQEYFSPTEIEANDNASVNDDFSQTECQSTKEFVSIDSYCDMFLKSHTREQKSLSEDELQLEELHKDAKTLKSENKMQKYPISEGCVVPLALNLNYIEQSVCCDSGTESGYGTTTESKSKSIPEVKVDPIFPNVSKTNEFTVDTKDIRHVSEQPHQLSKLSYIEKKLEITTQANTQGEKQNIKIALTDAEKVPEESQLSAVFDAKASCLESCIRSYEESNGMSNLTMIKNDSTNYEKTEDSYDISTPTTAKFLQGSNIAEEKLVVLGEIKECHLQPIQEIRNVLNPKLDDSALQNQLNGLPTEDASLSLDKESNTLTTSHDKEGKLMRQTNAVRMKENDIIVSNSRPNNANSGLLFDEYGDPVVTTIRSPQLPSKRYHLRIEEKLTKASTRSKNSEISEAEADNLDSVFCERYNEQRLNNDSTFAPSITITSPETVQSRISLDNSATSIAKEKPSYNYETSKPVAKYNTTRISNKPKIYKTSLNNSSTGNTTVVTDVTKKHLSSQHEKMHSTVSASEDHCPTMYARKYIIKSEFQSHRKIDYKNLSSSCAQVVSAAQPYLNMALYSSHQPHVTSSIKYQGIPTGGLDSSSFENELIASPPDVCQTNEEILNPKEFGMKFKGKYRNLDEQISRVLNPTPSPPKLDLYQPEGKTDIYQSEQHRHRVVHKAGKARRRVLFEDNIDEKPTTREGACYNQEALFSSNNPVKQTYVSLDLHSNKPYLKNISQRSTEYVGINEEVNSKDHYLALTHSDQVFSGRNGVSSNTNETTRKVISSKNREDLDVIEEALRFIRNNLDRDDYLIKNLEQEMKESWSKIKQLNYDDLGAPPEYGEVQNMSRCSRYDDDRSNKVIALEEVVGLLKKHVQQRELEINGLGGQLQKSNEKIKLLEKKLNENRSYNSDDYRHQENNQRYETNEVHNKLKVMQKEREKLKKKIDLSKMEKEDAQKATKKAYKDLNLERKKQDVMRKSGFSTISQERSFKNKKDDVREKIDDLDLLNKSSESELHKTELELDSLKRDNRSLRMNNDQVLVDLKTDNVIMREKLDRMHEISAENLLLQSDAADYQGELSELRVETKELRAKCHELQEEKRQFQAEIRDLRRYIDLLKANKTGDSRQDLLNKIEYYQMEHDRLMDEVRRLKQRLGEISPRGPSPCSPRSQARSTYPGPSSSYSPIKPNVKFSRSLERGRSPVSDALAAATASSLGASRITKERSLSPAAALNLRDLTMNRYHQHMDGPESPRSIDSESTEFLLTPQRQANGHGAPHISAVDPLSSDDENDDVELNLSQTRNGKLSGSPSSSHGGLRSGSNERMGCSYGRRSCSPTNPGGFRSVSPRLTSTQKNVHDTARDRYPTSIKRSLPRRAFAPRSPGDLKLGYCIKFTRPGGKLSRGTVRYIGHLPTRDEIFIGVELDGYDGKHSGTFQGTKYFTCPTNKGIFTPFSKVIMAWE